MRKIFALLLLIAFSPQAFSAVAPDVRISDADGDVLNINSDGTVPVSGGGGGSITFFDDSSTTGNVTLVGCSDSIATAITNATAGDTLVLGSCKYSISSALAINKAITIIGQGVAATIIDSGSNSIDVFDVTADGFHWGNLSIIGTEVDDAIEIDASASSVFTNIYGWDFDINISSSTYQDGISVDDSYVRLKNANITISPADLGSGSNQSRAIKVDGNSTAEANIYFYLDNVNARVLSTDTGAGSSNALIRGLRVYDNLDTNLIYGYINNSTFAGVDETTSPSNKIEACHVQGNGITVYMKNVTCDGYGRGTNKSSSTSHIDFRLDDGATAYVSNTAFTGGYMDVANGYLFGEGYSLMSAIDLSGGTKPPTGSGAVSARDMLTGTGPSGNDNNGTGSATAGEGSDKIITTGAGGDSTAATSTGTGGSGGDNIENTGAGGNATSASATANVGGEGGYSEMLLGAGGNASNGSTNTGGDGGSFYRLPGAGGTGSTANGKAGNFYLLSDQTLTTNRGVVAVNFTSDSDVIDSRIKLDVRGNGTGNAIASTGFSGTASTSGRLILAKARGSQATTTTVADNDDIGNIDFYGYDGNSWESTASIQSEVNGSVSDGVVPMRISFFTGTGASQTRRGGFNADGTFDLSANTTGRAGGDFEIRKSTDPDITFFRDDATVTSGELIGSLNFYNNDSTLTTQNYYAKVDVEAYQTISTDAAAGNYKVSVTGTTAGGAPVLRHETNERGFLVAMPSAQTIADTNTIAADACGGVKNITSAGAVTTNTTNTFTATPSTSSCVMDVINTGSNNIVLDNNADFHTASGADLTLGAKDAVRVAWNGTDWYQVSAVVDNT